MKYRLILTYAFNVFDLACTLFLVSAFGLAVEANPFGLALLQSPAAVIYKCVVVLGLLYILWLLRGCRLARLGAWVVFWVYAALAAYHITIFIFIGGF